MPQQFSTPFSHRGDRNWSRLHGFMGVELELASDVLVPRVALARKLGGRDFGAGSRA
ncbi:hypothetical protein X759_02595 [Mesorhizobium sp. LSHC420B00]|nr:hypothetical protein X759_02595 [Mesorhizobium sp. LSHC420B00]